MLSKMVGGIAVAALVWVGAALVLGSGGIGISVTPMRASDRLPTFSQVQARLDGRPDETPAPAPDAAPWARGETNAQSVRVLARRTALRALDEISRPSCRPGDSAALGYYFEQRAMQERGYAASWGPAGAEFIAQAWATPEDLRIVDAIRHAYEAGHLRAKELRPQHREHMLRLIGPVKPPKSVCG